MGTCAEFATKILESSSLQSWDTCTYSGILYWIDMILCEKKEYTKNNIRQELGALDCLLLGKKKRRSEVVTPIVFLKFFGSSGSSKG